MTDKIINWGAALPKKYKSDSLGDIPALHIKKLFRGIILSPSGGGKPNLVFHIIKNSPNVFSHLHLIARQPEQELYDYIKDTLNGFITVYDPDEPPSVEQLKRIQMVVFS